jgi:hypothetical protein
MTIIHITGWFGGTHWIRSWVGPSDGSDAEARKKYFAAFVRD